MEHEASNGHTVCFLTGPKDVLEGIEIESVLSVRSYPYSSAEGARIYG
jgi:hypothetical protein